MPKKKSLSKKAHPANIPPYGEVETVPAYERLFLQKNPSVLGGYLIREIEGGALLCWARLKSHAREALEQLEREWPITENELRSFRQKLGGM